MPTYQDVKVCSKQRQYSELLGRYRRPPLPVNILELIAVCFTLKGAFGDYQHPRFNQTMPCLWLTSVTMVGTRFQAAQRKADQILFWVEYHKFRPCPAVHIPGVENWQAESFSRHELDLGVAPSPGKCFRTSIREWRCPMWISWQSSATACKSLCLWIWWPSRWTHRWFHEIGSP